MTVKKELKIGILVIAVLTATFVVINFLRGTDILGREISIEGRFDNVETLVASAPVQIRGYAAGRVNEVEYDPVRDDFRVVCAVDKRFRIPDDSKMMIYSTSIMGGKGIRIELGESATEVKDKGVLATGVEADLISSVSGGIGPLIATITSLADSLKMTISGVNAMLDDTFRSNIASSIDHLKMTLANAQALSASLEGKSEAIERIIDNLSELSERLDPIAGSAAETIENVKGISAQLKNSDLEGTVGSLKGTLENINTAVEKISTPLDSLLNDADKLINEVKNNPKKYIKISVF